MVVPVKLMCNTNIFIEKAKILHKSKYDYSLVEYKHSKQKVKIRCFEHGVFEQRPNNHLTGSGCPLCAKKLVSEIKTRSNKEFILLAKKVYPSNDFNYSLVNYNYSQKKIKIICPKHGIFEQYPNHFLNGTSCPTCAGNITKTTNWFICKAKAW